VIPVYRSDAILEALVRRLEAVLAPIAASFELVLVNDCSPDRSWEVISGLVHEHHWVRGINLMRNYGQHNALLCGIRAARYDVIVTMDDDLQHPPEEIPKLLEKLAAGYDVVCTGRRNRNSTDWGGIWLRWPPRWLCEVPSARRSQGRWGRFGLFAGS